MRLGLTASIAALALALGGCDQLKQMTGTDEPANGTASSTNTATGSPSLSAPGDTGAKPATGSNPALEAEMQQAAAQIRGQLPIRADQITTVTGIRAEGTEFVYDMAISQEIPTAQVDMVSRAAQVANQGNLCGNPQTSTFIRRGGSMRHIYTDTAGHRFETRVASC